MLSRGPWFIQAVLALAGLIGSAPAQVWVNPLKGDLGVHDPVMIKQGKNYYMFATGNGISVKTSVDRINWKNSGRVITTLAQNLCAGE
jgi:hypothetical protein